MIRTSFRYFTLAAASLVLTSVSALAQGTPDRKEFAPDGTLPSTYFVQGNLVVVVEGCGIHGGTCTSVTGGTGVATGNDTQGGYGDNQASPLTLFQYSPAGTSSVSYVNSLVFPQTTSGANQATSGEYGSSSEGTMQLSSGTQYLTVMGYAINAVTFNAAYQPGFTADPYGTAGTGALAQSNSIFPAQSGITPISRVAALIDANGNINTSTTVYNVFSGNNPRSIYSTDNKNAWISGQGTSGDATGGVFYIPLQANTTSPVAITGLDTSANTASQDTREVQVYNNTLYISVDSKAGSNAARDFIGTLGTPPSTTLYSSNAGPTALTGFASSGKVTITSGTTNTGNGLNAGKQINISPQNYFFASPSVLYITDTGVPKNNSATSATGNGGLEKWINSSSNGTGTWSLAYTLYQNLGLVANTNTTGTPGLYGLAGVVSGSNVLLYATNYTLNDLDQTYLYGITDVLADTTPTQVTGETFTKLDTAPPNSNFKGIAFAPSFPAANVEILTVPSGLAVATSGSGCAAGGYIAPSTLAWTAGSTCTLSVVTPQAGSTGTQYAFASWDNGSTSTTRSVIAPTGTAMYTATFTTQYLLTTSATTGGTVSAGGYYTSGATATITATANSGYYFVNFTGSTTSTTNPLSLTINAPKTITANFAANDATSTTVSANPTSIPANSSTTLTATVKDTTNTGTTPTGSVNFTEGGIALGSCTLSGGTCSAVVSGTTLGQGSDSVTAAYVPAATFSASSGGTTVTVTAAVPAITFTSVGHNFGSVMDGSSTTGSNNYGVQMSNTSNVALTFTGISVSGSSSFTVAGQNCGTSLAAGAKCEIIFSFAPTNAGNQSATWSISGATAGTIFSPSNGGVLTGTGTTGAVTLTTAKHNFLTQTAGTTSGVFGAVLTNSTNNTITIAVAAPTGNTADFTTTANNCGTSLKSGAACNLQYEFTPVTTGNFAEFIGITANGGSTPVTVYGNPYTGLTLVGTGN